MALAACTGEATTRPTPTGLPPQTPPAQVRPSHTAAATTIPAPSPSSSPSPTPGAATVSPRGRLLLMSPGATEPATDFLPNPPERDIYRLASQLLPDVPAEVPRVVNPEPVSYSEGRHDIFNLVDLVNLEMYQRSYELRLVTPHAYWYVEEGLNVGQQDLERSAAIFEEDIYPRVTAIFGEEWSPGVDNDPHLNILNARLKGPIGGYYSSGDEYPESVSLFSNEREIIYINTSVLPMGSSRYLEVLAHELQHAAHWANDPTEETWINEGLSELATSLAGYPPNSGRRFLRSSPISLVHWPLSTLASGPSYGAASLFMHYLWEHYSNGDDFRALVSQQEDGIAGIDAYLEASGYQERFRDVFGDWAVANFLDEERGTYSYGDLQVQASVLAFVDGFSQFTSDIPQYSVEYVELTSVEGPIRLRFQASTVAPLLPTDVGPQGCWWSNSGDSISSTLTRPIDLAGTKRATLSYQVWYNLEEKWDYAYVELSVDGGRTWQILETANTSPENPIGNSYGPGYTGDSGGWLSESVDLSPFAGRKNVLLRFQYVTDDAINGAGICFREISVAEAGLDAASAGWEAEGFILTHNRVRQDYIVQLIQVGEENRVTTLVLDKNNTGEMAIAAHQDWERLVVAVAALAPKTREDASYTLTVEPAG